MATVEIQVFVVPAKPVEDIVPHALYLVKTPTSKTAQMYKGNADGTEVILFSDGKQTIHFGSVKPEEGSDYSFWYDDENLVLYINLPDEEGGDHWMTAFHQAVLPGFAGTGIAETMARSDHYHEGQRVVNPTW